MNPFRIAVVGLGWAAQKRHLPVLRRGSLALLGVVDKAPDRARSIGERWRCKYHATASSLADVRWLNEVNAVSIATDPTAQTELIAEALARGRHVVTETPFAMTLDEGVKLADAARRADRKLAVIHNLQFAQSTRKLLADIASGALGDICSVYARQFGHLYRPPPAWREQLPFGSFYEECPRLLALLRAVVGPIALTRSLVVPAVDGLKTPIRLEAWFNRDAAGYPIRLSFDFENPLGEAHLSVLGTKAAGIIDIGRDFYYVVPLEEGAHLTAGAPKLGAGVSLQRWFHAAASKVPVLGDRSTQGYEEVFLRFERSLFNKVGALESISPEDALAVLGLQHDIISRAETVCRTMSG